VCQARGRRQRRYFLSGKMSNSGRKHAPSYWTRCQQGPLLLYLQRRAARLCSRSRHRRVAQWRRRKCYGLCVRLITRNMPPSTAMSSGLDQLQSRQPVSSLQRLPSAVAAHVDWYHPARLSLDRLADLSSGFPCHFPRDGTSLLFKVEYCGPKPHSCTVRASAFA
jgi:hypothetical protein